MKGNKFCLGYRHTPEAINKISESHSGEKHYRWISDRSKILKNTRNNPVYKQWVKEIKKRDKQCQLKDENCNGCLVVHHIKSWSKYPKLRYKIINGITLFQDHHPTKRRDEIKLLPVFEALVKVK